MMPNQAEPFPVKDEFDQWVQKLREAVENGDMQGGWEQIDNRTLQALTECLIQIYSRKVRQADQRAGEQEAPQPLSPNNRLTQTDVVIFVDRLLRLKEIELFEVQMFRSIG